MTVSVFVVDDEQSMLEWLSVLLEQKGYQVKCFASAKKALRAASSTPPDVLLSDIKMPQMTGIELFGHMKRQREDLIGIFMTAFSSVDTAVGAIREGASDYLLKPFEVEQLNLSMEKALRQRRMERENRQLRSQVRHDYDFSSITGKSKALMRVLEQVRVVADKKSTVLITGESGTGKELIAKALHYNSSRAEGPFLGVNCGSLTRSLLESELFGHVKGSFTGAHRDKEGLLAAASGGTFFLDEVSELHPELQVKLLRALQERQVLPVGGTEYQSFDVRLVAATNKNLRRRVDSGSFRADLYYRLNVIPIHVPALRDRPEDIPLLVERFVEENCSRHSISPKHLTEEAMEELKAYPWPGNVRELENMVERICVMTSREQIDSDDLPDLPPTGPQGPIGAKAVGPAGERESEPTLREIEKAYTYYVLEHKADGQKRLASQILGIDESTLHRRLERYRKEEEGG
ncbi:MAG: sigma-54 dependent transcriptional regulator [Candidatus Fermentibacteraceae bacterium]